MLRFTVRTGDAQLFAEPDLTAARIAVPVNSIVEGDFITPGGAWPRLCEGRH
jgi:hypothetical protein